jgi:hypothetical protein
MLKKKRLARKKLRSKSKKGSLSSLEKKLDQVFSWYIRKSHADKNGYCKCVTCGKVVHWKDIQCGHFISRRHKATRWEEKNCGPQCVGCNIYNQGAGPAYASYLIRKYGEGIVDLLLAKSRSVWKGGRFEYEAMISEYEEKLKQYTHL